MRGEEGRTLEGLAKEQKGRHKSIMSKFLNLLILPIYFHIFTLITIQAGCLRECKILLQNNTALRAMFHAGFV